VNASELRRIEGERGIRNDEMPAQKCSNRKKLALKHSAERWLEIAASPKAGQKQ